MRFKLDLICLYIYFLQIIFVPARSIKIAHFKVSSRSSTITKCASHILSKSGINGVRVSASNGTCEDVSGQWDEESSEAEYEDAKLMSSKKNFKPPIRLQDKEERYFNHSISNWQRISLNITWPEESWSRIIFLIQEPLAGDTTNRFYMDIRDYVNRILITDSDSRSKRVTYSDELPGTQCKITFASDGNSAIKVLFNDTTIVTWESSYLRLDRLERILIYYSAMIADKRRNLIIYDNEFIQD